MEAENLKSLKWIRDVLLKDRTCIADLYSHSGILCVGNVVEHGNGWCGWAWHYEVLIYWTHGCWGLSVGIYNLGDCESICRCKSRKIWGECVKRDMDLLCSRQDCTWNIVPIWHWLCKIFTLNARFINWRLLFQTGTSWCITVSIHYLIYKQNWKLWCKLNLFH